MRRGRRSDLLLGGLALVAIANGLLLGLSLYGLLALALKVVQIKPPSLGYAWAAGALAALVLLGLSLQRARKLREGEHGLWTPFPTDDPEHPVARRFRALVGASSLDRSPVLGWVESSDRNAFAVGRSRDEASIVVTSGLIEQLQPAEMDAVLAQELAHVELEDLKAVGLANAVANSISDLARARGRIFWGPRTIVADMWPFLLVSAVAFLVIPQLPRSGGNEAFATLVPAAVSFAALYALWVTVKRSWYGLAQLFLFLSFLGPISLVEAALAPPTAVLLSRLVSRARIHEADARSVELTGNRDALISVLEKLEVAEHSSSGSWLDRWRFALFVTALPRGGYRAWLARLYATHPSIASRIETIRALD